MLTPMRHIDTGHCVDVHPDMVEHYEAGGYREVEPDVDDARAVPTQSQIAHMRKPQVIAWLKAHGCDVDETQKVAELRKILHRVMFVEL